MLVTNSVQGEAVLTKYLGRKGLSLLSDNMDNHHIISTYKSVQLSTLQQNTIYYTFSNNSLATYYILILTHIAIMAGNVYQYLYQIGIATCMRGIKG